MPALTDPIIDTRTPAERIAAQVLRSILIQADQIERSYNLNYERIWQTPGVDPRDVLAALGGKAGPVFQITNQIMGLARPAALKAIPDRYTYTIDAEGTITLTDVPVPDSASEGADQA